MSDFEVKPLGPETWHAFAALVERHNGVWGGCWCTYFHPTTPETAEGNRRVKQGLVEDGKAHAALVFDGDRAVAWCQYGPPEELPNVQHNKQYLAEMDLVPDYRITCFFVDRDYRRNGTAGVALDGALGLIAQAGGGVVESYPQDTFGEKTSASFLYNATRTMFEQAGFTYIRSKGKKHSVMRKTVRAKRVRPKRGACELGRPASVGSGHMDMLMGAEIAEANLTEWRKLAQGLHARYTIDDFATAARFVAAIGDAGDALGHHPLVSIGPGYVDLKLITVDAVYREDDGTEHVVEWPTQQDVDLARRITEIAADHQLEADPASVSVIELGLDTPNSATIAPVWAALLTGNPEAQGHGSPSDEIRDAMGRVPNLWFGDAADDETPRQRIHVEVYVAPEVREQRIADAIAAGGTVVDDSKAPFLTVIADQDGNTGVVCVDASAAKQD